MAMTDFIDLVDSEDETDVRKLKSEPKNANIDRRAEVSNSVHHLVARTEDSPRKRQKIGDSTTEGTVIDPLDLLEEEGDNTQQTLRESIRAIYAVHAEPAQASKVEDLTTNSRDLSLEAEEKEKLLDFVELDDDSLTTIDLVDLTGIEEAISCVDDDNSHCGNEEEVITAIKINGVKCAKGKTIEFQDKSFMKIERIVSSEGQTYLIGQLLVRLDGFGAKAPKRRNEVVWITLGTESVDGMSRRRLVEHELVRNRELIMTNYTWPKISNLSDCDKFVNRFQEVNLGRLYCRMKRVEIFAKGTSRITEEAWILISEEEADSKYRMERNVIQNDWRGPFERGGSHVSSVLNLNDNASVVELNHQYTFGDAFCGAGGTSCGARAAGLYPTWSFDYDESPVLTYRRNFTAADCRYEPVDSFINAAGQTDFKVDVLHMSPPCQPFSPAHTIESIQKDDRNRDTLFSVGELLERVKPRIATIEETAGLCNRHDIWFSALIHIFLRIGYSMRWKLIECSDYGVPQMRKRLVIIAAAPGEDLPPFPAPTHDVTGLARPKPDTIGKILRSIPATALNHDPKSCYFDATKLSFDPETYAKTITCNSGIGNYHPSGERRYTVRELACLQTFPITFKLADVGVSKQKRQIGNAVPPVLAKAICKEIIKSLKKTDGIA